MNTQTATITVKYINPVKPGGKKGSVKTADGQLYLVWPDKLAQFQQNTTYEVEYMSDVGNDGREWRTIKTVLPTGHNGAATVAHTGYVRPVQSGGRPAQQYRPTAPQDAERMWTCSLVNAGIQAGQVNVLHEESIASAAVCARRVWRDLWGEEETQH